MTFKEKIIMLIFSDAITGYQMLQKTGVSRSTYSEIRRGRRNINNLTVGTAEKMEAYYDELEAENLISRDEKVLEDYYKYGKINEEQK